jgi:hypothetical protein
MKLWKIRRSAYRTARVLGDFEAVQKGPQAVERRVLRKVLGRLFGRLLRRI